MKALMLESLFEKLAGSCNFIKKTPTKVFSSEVSEIFKNTFFYRTPPVAASVYKKSNLFVYKFVVTCQVFQITPSGCTL